MLLIPADDGCLTHSVRFAARVDAVRTTLRELPRRDVTLWWMKRLRVLFERLRARRPPTGPLTTAERTTADELHEKTVAAEAERSESPQGQRGRSAGT
jgi:hypothetical protein